MGKASTKSRKDTKTYNFKVEIEPDDDRWFACCPTLEDRGVATWGHTREEALKNIREVLEMTIESMIDHGESIPEESSAKLPSEVTIEITV
ncbi:type II toxin-antitoxin system HicB family antitoxin [Candidatus Poribacteria bacterium]